MTLVANRANSEPVPRSAMDRFAGPHQVEVTPYNGTAILRYLHVTRSSAWTGMSVGFAVMFAEMFREPAAVSPFWPIAGWFCGVAGAEIVMARRGAPLGRPLGVRLATPSLTLWAFTAVLSAALALDSVLRSFRTEVDPAERGWAVCTLAVVLTVNLLVMGLHRRPLRAGPADLVAAELAMRSRSARLLLTGGTVVAIWSAPVGGDDPNVIEFRTIAGVVVSLLAWLMALSAEPVRPARRPLRWRLITAVLLTPVLAAWLATGSAGPGEAARPPIEPYANAVLYAHLSSHPDQWMLAAMPGDREWDESSRDFGGWEAAGPALDAATSRPAADGTGRRTMPPAISGDGHHVAYLDSVTNRLVLRNLPQGTVRDLTGPLTAVPQPFLSHDGRLAALVSATGTELVDTATGVRTALPGVRRVLGLGPYGVIGTTGHRALAGAPDTKLVTLDRRGRVRSEVPFDPTRPALAAPDGRSLVVLTADEVVTMDPRTGRVTDRAALHLPRRYGAPEPLGWSADGGLAVRIDPVGDDRPYHVVAPGTGRSSPLKGLTLDIEHITFGRIL